ncbi:nucleolar protein of 40 kDa isoform X1 [Trachemys scripta elegans]|uniref:nucleolar protein of 40 kDa isoform X1 n=2 Tax=Trachemys scripta elegans TaxID=31138 RepID=UPI0015575383|nr:nucleolar protein of 40 kDa isoform X1 [Trachemys scripta elegans]XP_034610177.1 nucleolar protein of 40 kDa isoform X1 [Trachemys scripta elegans]XP_034610178.1 nucleolar protein of 40 kDa isoform X1 [Trachemys scripta elegans]XP_034610179.1 nucleolar protein of 40 kDa isoform X1 [Trachemys scripta elegans]
MKSMRPETTEPLPELYDVFQGEVAAVTEYGAFIKIPGCRKQGLVHRTHMSACRVDKPSEMVDVGDKVWVKLIGREMKDDKLKLSLSMKVVNQGTGKDLDPNNVALDQDERKKRSFRDYTSQKITLEAVLNTVCKKCGCKGHFAKECFMQPGGTKYSLIPEEEEEETAEYEGDKKSSHAENSSKKKKRKRRRKRNTRARSHQSPTIQTAPTRTVMGLSQPARGPSIRRKLVSLRRRRRKRSIRKSTRNEGERS